MASRDRAPSRGHRRVLAAALSVLLAAPAVLAPTVAFADDAKASLAAAEKSARAKDWTKAATEFEASNRAQPSAAALEGLANAYYQSKQDAAAFAAYTEWNKTYGGSAPVAKKGTVNARLKELEGRTGALVLDLAAADGATVLVDDKALERGVASLPIRLSPGPHRVRVTKDGFLPFDQLPNVTAGGTTNLVVKLEPLSSKGRLAVKETTGKPVRVIVDGVDMGDAPWSGEVEAGVRDVALRAPGYAATPQKVTVERGKTHEVEIVASPSTATLKVTTNDGKGLIYIDDKLVGEGTFSLEIPSGPHSLRITREGYDPFEEQIDLKEKETLARSVTLNLSSKIETSVILKDPTRLEGLYGGVNLLYSFLPSGMGHTMEKACGSDVIAPGNSDALRPPSLVSCDGAGGSAGGGLTGFIGYHWDPVGVELFMAGQYDQSSPTLTWSQADLDPGFGPNPARREEFHVRRLGGALAARVRLTFQGEKIRFSVASGVGLAYRVMLLDRDTVSLTDSTHRDVHIPDAQSYLSPVLSLEPSVQYRLGQHLAVALGLSLLVENPAAFDQTPTTNREQGRRLGPNGLDTPSYELATSTQIYVGPFLGLMFGP